MPIAPGGPPRSYVRLAQSAALASALEFRECFVFVAAFSMSLSYRAGTVPGGELCMCERLSFDEPYFGHPATWDRQAILCQPRSRWGCRPVDGRRPRTAVNVSSLSVSRERTPQSVMSSRQNRAGHPQRERERRRRLLGLAPWLACSHRRRHLQRAHKRAVRRRARRRSKAARARRWRRAG
eukprot:scaffold57753_cov66-Phaeocystis_antarctica.AAC.1